jgi:hypothetical protein
MIMAVTLTPRQKVRLTIFTIVSLTWEKMQGYWFAFLNKKRWTKERMEQKGGQKGQHVVGGREEKE